jgi:hypothetical protein
VVCEDAEDSALRRGLKLGGGFGDGPNDAADRPLELISQFTHHTPALGFQPGLGGFGFDLEFV